MGNPCSCLQMKGCKVPEAELALDLGNVEMDVMDSLQVLSDCNCVGLDSVSVSGAFFVRKRPGESSIPQAALSLLRALAGKGAIAWARGCWNALVAVSVVLQILF